MLDHANAGPDLVGERCMGRSAWRLVDSASLDLTGGQCEAGLGWQGAQSWTMEWRGTGQAARSGGQTTWLGWQASYGWIGVVQNQAH